jgi:ubiquinone/menaquinone biosynthesis C-methylase UbiE
MRFKPTVLADAHYLPFKDGSFKAVKASHVLEHLRNPSKALDEILRVATKDVILSFPTEWDVLPFFVSQIFPIPHFLSLKWVYQTRKKRLHLWVIKPEVIMSYLRNKGWECTCEKNTLSVFPFFEGGRKAKYFKWLTRNFRIPFEYAILAKKHFPID